MIEFHCFLVDLIRKAVKCLTKILFYVDIKYTAAAWGMEYLIPCLMQVYSCTYTCMKQLQSGLEIWFDLYLILI